MGLAMRKTLKRMEDIAGKKQQDAEDSNVRYQRMEDRSNHVEMIEMFPLASTGHGINESWLYKVIVNGINIRAPKLELDNAIKANNCQCIEYLEFSIIIIQE